MSLIGYRTFVKIVETGSLAATAREQHLSPSAVSKQLASLEERLGAKLIQRSTRSIQVTPVGEHFYRRCQGVIQAADAAESEVRDLLGDIGGVVKITLPQAMATADFSRLMQDFRITYPTVSLDIGVSNAPYNLIGNNLDVAFRAGKLKDSRLIAIELFRSNVIMCASPDYIDRCGLPESLDELRSHTLLVPSHHYLPPDDSVEEGLSSYTKDNHILCDDLGLLIELAKSGAGVGVLWESYANAEIEKGNLMQIDSPLNFESRALNMIYLSREYMPRRVVLFLEHVKRHYGKKI